MKVFLTGASGYIGGKLARLLAVKGYTVHALIRSAAAKTDLQHPNIFIFKGDVLQKESLLPAVEGCRQVYHTAAKVGAWARRPQDFYDVNVGGTKNVLEAATEAGVEKIVFTSTAGVLGPAEDNPLTENPQRSAPFLIDYDRSKKEAEDLFFSYQDRSLKKVAVRPAKVFGPGKIAHSLTANALMQSFLQRGVALIPSPGTYRVCFAYVDDVVDGHVLAMEWGADGESYILGGINISYYDFFDCIRSCNQGKGRIVTVPKGIIKVWAYLQELNHRLTGSAVRFPARSVDLLFSNHIFSSEKAIAQLGYHITPLSEAVYKTVLFLKENKDV